MEHVQAMNPTEEQPGIDGDGSLRPDSDATSEETSSPGGTPEGATEEPQAASPSGDAPKKRLSTGRDAAAHAKGATLKSLGVATIRMAVEAEKSNLPAEDEGEFDPASDLPMYRPGMDWFVLRVASNKEGPVRETLLRKVQIEGMEDLVGRIMVPTEKTKTLKGRKQRITETKLYPGYSLVSVTLRAPALIDWVFSVGTMIRPTMCSMPSI